MSEITEKQEEEKKDVATVKEQKRAPFLLTEDMLLKAETYIPLMMKREFAEIVAPDCIEPVEMSVQKTQSDATVALPQMYEEKPHMRQLYLLQFFLLHYLKLEDVPDEFSAKEYDYYASSHLFCQLDKLKNKATSSEVKDKVYCLLADFRELQKWLDRKIGALLKSHNDALERFLAGIAIASSPDAVRKLTEELKEVSGDLTAKLKERAKKRVAADKRNVKKPAANVKVQGGTGDVKQQQQSVQSEH